MAKRTFSEFSQSDEGAYEAVSQIVQNAEALLKAAQTLKEKLDAGRRNGGPDKTVMHEDDTAALRTVCNRIAPAVDHFSQPTAGKHTKIDQGHQQSAPIPAPASLSPWSPEQIATSLPPQPPILDPVLEHAAFTHSGMVARPGDLDYERLEWLGDAYLYVMASALIYQTFPGLTAGRSSQLREILIRNRTLEKFNIDYGMNRRMNFPAEYNLNGRTGGTTASQKKKEKILGDVFEAYVAGAILGDPANGVANVSAWMKALWSRELAGEIQKEFRERRSGLLQHAEQVSRDNSHDTPQSSTSQSDQARASNADTPAKVRLQQAIGTTGIKLEYRDMGPPTKEKRTGLPWFTVAVYLTGWGVKDFRLGFGSALSKSEAGARAAKAALDNKKMIRGFAEKKKDWLATRDVQQQHNNLGNLY